MALSWAQTISRGNLTVKGVRASEHQAAMMMLIVTIAKARGGDVESQAGAVATSIQESSCSNIGGGDRDSVGLFQQRPSMDWGTYDQCHTPTYAINKFLDQYLAYRRKGYGWLAASHATQRSAYPSAPARWFTEGIKAARTFAGADATAIDAATAGGLGDATGGMTGGTRSLPYEFSRGSSDQKETSWDCIGRLADEVGWQRFMRRGTLWFVSQKWLAAQKPVYRLHEFSRGVVDLSFDWETRRPAAEATLQCIARRYALAPGDVVELYASGPADGNWLVSDVHRPLASAVAELTLKRAGATLPEPAPQTQTIVAGSPQTGSSTSFGPGTPAMAARAYQAAEIASSQNWKYSQPMRNHQCPNGYADCSSGVSWVLSQAGIHIPGAMSPNAPVSGAYESWGAAGYGRYFTVMCNAGHVWIRWNGIGPAWRFDTSSYGDSYTASSGGRNRTTPRPTTGFVTRHWPGL